MCSYLLRRRKRQNHCRRRLGGPDGWLWEKVLFVQFFKGGETGEINLFLGLPQFQILRSEKPFPFTFQMDEAQKQELREIHNGLLRQALEQCRREAFGLAVLDEAFRGASGKFAG